MSQMAQQLTRHRPDWAEFPEDLERAWAWMEEQGLGRTAAAGYLLSPYPDHAGSSPAFLAGLTLEGWFDEGTPAHAQLLPIAEAAGDGSQLALWRDDEGRVRVVVLESEGTGYLVAEDARALLTLLAVGYDEIIEMNLGDAPADPVPADALAPLRDWVGSELGVTVPEEWPAVGGDEFSAWLDHQLGRETATVTAPEDRGTQVTGEVTVLLSLLGLPDGPEVTGPIAELTGAKLKERLRSSTAALRKVGLEAESGRHGLTTIWVRMTDREFGPIIKVAAPAYPHPAALIDGLDATSTLDDVLTLLGPPEKQGPNHLRYVVGGRFLHLAFEETLTQATLMLTAP